LPAETQNEILAKLKKIMGGFANPFPENSFAKPSPHFKINTLVERSREIREKRKVERKIRFVVF